MKSSKQHIVCQKDFENLSCITVIIAIVNC